MFAVFHPKHEVFQHGRHSMFYEWCVGIAEICATHWYIYLHHRENSLSKSAMHGLIWLKCIDHQYNGAGAQPKWKSLPRTNIVLSESRLPKNRLVTVYNYTWLFPFNDWAIAIAHFHIRQALSIEVWGRWGGTQSEVEYNFGDLGITGVGLPSRTAVLKIPVATEQKNSRGYSSKRWYHTIVYWWCNHTAPGNDILDLEMNLHDIIWLKAGKVKLQNLPLFFLLLHLRLVIQCPSGPWS